MTVQDLDARLTEQHIRVATAVANLKLELLELARLAREAGQVDIIRRESGRSDGVNDFPPEISPSDQQQKR